MARFLAASMAATAIVILCGCSDPESKWRADCQVTYPDSPDRVDQCVVTRRAEAQPNETQWLKPGGH
jgi:hypothetical protein